MADSIKAGLYSVAQILGAAGFDFAQAEGDHRRVKVGRLSFDSLDDEILVPATAQSLDIELDGQVQASLTIEGQVEPVASTDPTPSEQ